MNELSNSVSDTAVKKDQEGQNIIHSKRRYVGKHETLGYIFNHWAGGFNISKFRNRYIYDVLLINFNYLAFLDAVGGIWDVVNDTIIGFLVDRTRTRWGKFRPYLIGFNIPMAFFACFYWLLPFIFADTGDMYLPKFIAYFIFSVVSETAGTFTLIASTGLLSTLTPQPLERTRLITQAQVFSIGSNIPELIMGLLLDLINSKKLNVSHKNLFAGFGISTNFIAAAASLYFFAVSKERVVQSIEKPSIIQGIKSILNNKPILLITLSEFFEGFAVGTSMTDYYIDVLGSATLQTIVGIPGGFFTYTGYATLGRVRRHFSTRALWIISDIWTDICWLSVCAIGIINKNFTKVSVMVPVIMIEECFEMCVYAIRKVVPSELYNEAMDYCEWKNGYRTEAMTSVARGLITKLQRIVNSVVKNIIMGKIGYKQGRVVGTQSYKTKYWLFVLSTGLPVITGALGVIPKFFYPLTGKKRDQMYKELIERREAIAHAAKNASAEDMRKIADMQMHADFSFTEE